MRHPPGTWLYVLVPRVRRNCAHNPTARAEEEKPSPSEKFNTKRYRGVAVTLNGWRQGKNPSRQQPRARESQIDPGNFDNSSDALVDLVSYCITPKREEMVAGRERD